MSYLGALGSCCLELIFICVLCLSVIWSSFLSVCSKIRLFGAIFLIWGL